MAMSRRSVCKGESLQRRVHFAFERSRAAPDELACPFRSCNSREMTFPQLTDKESFLEGRQSGRETRFEPRVVSNFIFHS